MELGPSFRRSRLESREASFYHGVVAVTGEAGPLPPSVLAMEFAFSVTVSLLTSAPLIVTVMVSPLTLTLDTVWVPVAVKSLVDTVVPSTGVL